MHVWPLLYCYARVTSSNQGNYSFSHEGGHNNSSTDEQIAMCKPVIEAGLPYYFLST
jgi:hypothetical protein